MAYSFIVSAGAGGTASTVTTGAVTTTGANLIVIGVTFDTTAARIISDSKSNTWTPLTATTSLSAGAQLYYCYAPTVGTSHTFSNTGTNNYSTLFMMAFSGALTSPFDVENGATGSTGTTLATGSVTPSVDNELLVTFFGFNLAGTPISIDNSFNQDTAAVDFSAANHYGGGMAYKVQTTATAVNPTWTRTNSGLIMSARIATFKAAASGSSVTYTNPNLKVLNTMGVGT